MIRTDIGLPDPRDLDRILLDELRGLGDEAELAFAAHARHATGRMARNIKAHVRGMHVDVTVFARDPTSGYDYVGVTRFGHKVERIYPRADRRPAHVVATGRRRGTGRQASLRFVIGGRVVFAKSVRAFHPDHDWAEDAMPQIEASAQRAMRRVQQRIELH